MIFMRDYRRDTLFQRPRRRLNGRVFVIFTLLGLIGVGTTLALRSGDNSQPGLATSGSPDTGVIEAGVAVPLALPGQTLQPTSTPEPAVTQATGAEPAATDTQGAATDDAPEPVASITPPVTPVAAAATSAANLPETSADELMELPAEAAALPTTAPVNWQIHKVKSGDSLAGIVGKMGVGPTELHTLLHSDKQAKRLKNIQPGQTIRVALSDDGHIEQLIHDISKLKRLEIRREGDDFKVALITADVERRSNHAKATIEQSLFLAAQSAGIPDGVTMDLATIFGWDIDFALDVRTGDRFSLIYEELYLNGEKVGNGNILAAEFTNRGQTYRAVRYTDAAGSSNYYTPAGKSMRKAFLRTPVEFSRISSYFSKGRKHPVLNRIRAHKGVDYAAPRGTPIRATGKGTIVHRGKKGGYGRVVIVQHGQRYRTLYAHMSRYSKLRKGSRVKQGQIIGYVGSSGLATGPHLHYEFHVNGVHRNPLRVKLPAAEPIAPRHKEDFLAQTRPLLAQLDTISSTIVALNQ